LMFWKGFSQPQDGPLPTAEQAVTVRKPSWRVAAGLCVFLALYFAFMFWGEDFAYQDGHAFTDYSAIGVTRPPSVWQSVGRFWPLGYQEYNLIAHLSPTASAYLLFAAGQLVVGLWLLYQAMPHLHPTLRLLTFPLLMLGPAIGADFAELTYADRNVVFAICVLIFLVHRYELRPRLSLLLAAIVVTHFALYFKETSAALFGGFAIARVVLKGSRAGIRAAFESPLELGILLSCAYFALLLGATLLPAGTSSYVNQGSVGRATATFRYLTGDPLLLAFLVAFSGHVILTLRRRAKFDPLWDSLAFGAVLHIMAVISTGLACIYLMGPSELVAALTLVRLVSRWWEERPQVRPILASVGGATVALTITFGSFRLIERKNCVWQWEKIASFVVDYYKKSGAQHTRLYLPANGGVIMNFLSFLRYRGLHFQMAREPAGAEAIEVAGSDVFPGDVCVNYEDFVCHQDSARVGDLVVRLGEESWAPMDPGLRRGDEVLGLHEARLLPLFRALPAA
ncbi:MAG TPA: hypothetical protein VGC79_06910, partial [Polyangiaceae bacterium]